MFPAPPSFIIVALSTLFWGIAKGIDDALLSAAHLGDIGTLFGVGESSQGAGMSGTAMLTRTMEHLHDHRCAPCSIAVEVDVEQTLRLFLLEFLRQGDFGRQDAAGLGEHTLFARGKTMFVHVALCEVATWSCIHVTVRRRSKP